MNAARSPKPVPILIAAAVMMSVAMGMRTSMGLFLPSVTRDLAVSASDFGLAMAIQNIAWGVAQTPLGIMADKWGIRPVVLGGAATYALAMAVLAMAGGLPALILSCILSGIAVASTGSALAMTASARAVSPERRSLILGIVSAFSVAGTLVIAPALQFILAHWDWRLGAVLFVLIALTLLPAAFVTGSVDRMPQPVQKRAPLGEVIGLALRTRPFVVLCCTYFVCGLQLIFVNLHLPNYLALCGQDPMLGATALSIIGGVNIVGCWTAGWLGGRYPKYILLGLTYLGRSAVLTAYFIFPPTPTSTIVFAAAMGFLWLGVIPLVSGYVAELFGTRFMATILGLSFVIHQIGSVTGAWGGGLIFDAFGSYDLAWRFGVVVGAAAGVAQILFGGPVRPKRDAGPVLAAG